MIWIWYIDKFVKLLSLPKLYILTLLKQQGKMEARQKQMKKQTIPALCTSHLILENGQDGKQMCLQLLLFGQTAYCSHVSIT